MAGDSMKQASFHSESSDDISPAGRQPCSPAGSGCVGIEEAARLLAIRPTLLRRLISTGKIRSGRIGNRRVVSREEISRIVWIVGQGGQIG